MKDRRHTILRRQRGVISLMGALTLLIAVLFMAISVDTGRLYLERRSLQRIADASAMETALQHGYCGTGQLASAKETAQLSAARNGYAGDLTGETDAVLLGYVQLAEGGSRRQFVTNVDRPEAVFVNARKTVPASLVAGGMFGEQIELFAQAVATRAPAISMSGGSWAARLDAQSSPLLNLLLNQLLNSQLGLDLASYRGLAKSNLTLLQLAHGFALLGVELAVGTVDELLAASVSVADLLEAVVVVLDRDNTLDMDVNLLRTQLLNGNLPQLNMALGDILDVQAPIGERDAALRTGINVLDLIMATAMAANKRHALELDLAIPLNIPGLASLNSGVKLFIVEPPKLAIGPPGRDANGEWRTQMQTAQVRLQTGLGLGIGTAVPGAELINVDLGLALSVADGRAWFESMQCGTVDAPGSVVMIGAQPGIASVQLGTFSDIESGNGGVTPPAVINIAGLVEVRLGFTLPLNDGQEQRIRFVVDDREDLPQTESVSSNLGGSLGNGLRSLGNSLVLEVSVFPGSGGLLGLIGNLLGEVVGLIVGIVVPLLSDVLATVLNVVGEQLLDPLLGLLGLKLGGMDIQLLDIHEGNVELII